MTNTAPKDIVIVGGGIAGITTAYYLATHPQRPEGSKVTVVEGTKVAAGASGYSGGFLAKDWHGSATSSLAAMSYDLHEELSDKFGGAEKWGYRTVETLSIDTDATRQSKRAPPLPWLTKDVQMSRKLGSHSTTAQVHPGLFTKFFSEQFLAQPGTELKIGQVVGMEMSTTGTQAQTTQKLGGSKETKDLAVQSPKSVRVKTTGGEEEIPADLVVIAAGPWTGSLALKMLGNKVGGKLGVSGSRAHSIVLKTKEELTAHCLFTSMSMEDGSVGEPEVYARPDGTTYICGAGDEEPLPPSADLVKPSPKAIAKLHAQAKALSPVFQPENAETQAEQACFLPIPDRGRPLVGKVQGVEGVYVGSGLSCWGITQGPGMGKVLSEMILEGKAKSADVSMLAP